MNNKKQELPRELTLANQTNVLFWIVILWVVPLLACGKMETGSFWTERDEIPRFHCGLNEDCPALMIQGDPMARLEPISSPYRGYGDPSLEYDPLTGVVWLSYSWLDILIDDVGPPPVFDFGVRTHLARSDDNGRTFSYVQPLNETTAWQHEETGVEGWAIHEVSTLMRRHDGYWQLLWLSYFQPIGPEERSEVHYRQKTAVSPTALAGGGDAWIQGFATGDWIGSRYQLNELAELEDCAAFTEPALFAYEDEVYLATNCIVFRDGRIRQKEQNLVLLRQLEEGYEYVGELLTSEDSADLGVERIEQADLSFSRSGEIILLVTPIKSGNDPDHLGCIVYTVEDIRQAKIKRAEDGKADPRMIISADGNGLGPGLCTYDPHSESGVLMVITDFKVDQEPPDLLFSLRVTGQHP